MRKTIRVTYDSKHYLDHWYYESGNKRISLINLISKNTVDDEEPLFSYKNCRWEIVPDKNFKNRKVERFATREEAEKRIEELLPPISIIKPTDDLYHHRMIGIIDWDNYNSENNKKFNHIIMPLVYIDDYKYLGQYYISENDDLIAVDINDLLLDEDKIKENKNE